MKLLISLVLLSLPIISWAQFKNESEFSTVATGGNSEVETYLAKTSSDYAWDMNAIKLGGHYTYGESSNTVSARDWDVNTKYDRFLTERFALTFGQLTEGYRFQGIKARYNADAGVKYFWLKSDAKNFFSELGYRYTIEDRYSPDENQYSNKARAYAEWNHKYSETFQYKFWAEYVPNFSQSKDYLAIYEASLTSILTSMFSLKVAYRGMYDNVPGIAGNKNYDYTYTTSLVAKF
ncbi:MAG: DUF481 domain-containing protein [Bacteriovoracaceae bacterium]